MRQLFTRPLVMVLVVVAGLAWLAIRWGISAAGPRGLRNPADSQLAGCPQSPNCVSSQATTAAHRIDSWVLKTPPPASLELIASVVRQQPRSRIVTLEANYLHAEFRSRIFGFVDDVEFLWDGVSHSLQVRSASRLGYSDFGVNRRRVEQLRAQVEGLTQLPLPAGGPPESQRN